MHSAVPGGHLISFPSPPPSPKVGSVGSDTKLVVGNVGGVSVSVGKDVEASEAVDSVVGYDETSYDVDVEDCLDVTPSLVLGSIVDVVSPTMGKGDPGDSFPVSPVDDSEVNIVVSLKSFVLPVG